MPKGTCWHGVADGNFCRDCEKELQYAKDNGWDVAWHKQRQESLRDSGAIAEADHVLDQAKHGVYKQKERSGCLGGFFSWLFS